MGRTAWLSWLSSDVSSTAGMVDPVFRALGVTGMFENFRIFNKTTAGFRGFAFPALAHPGELLSDWELPNQAAKTE